MDNITRITSNSKWSPDSPREEWEGANPVYQFTIPGVTTITSPSAKLYQGSTDKSSSCVATQPTANGNVVSGTKLQNLIGGNTYVLEIWGTADGVVDMLVALEIQVIRPGGRS